MDTPYSTHTTSRNLTYSYLHLFPSPSRSQSSKPQYILFLHGFPSSSYDFRYQITHFHTQGYGIIAPDLLGYGDTSKPENVKMYSGKAMARDIVEILEKEGLGGDGMGRVVGVAHDWGSYLLSRMMNWYPDLFSKMVFIDVGYTTPPTDLSLQALKNINGMVKKHAGYEVFGYFMFFGEEGAVELLNQNIESIRSLMYTKDEIIAKKYMGAEGGTRKWLEGGMNAPAVPFYTSSDAKHYSHALSGRYHGPTNWYRAQLLSINAEDDAAVPKGNKIIKKPTLLITSGNFIANAGGWEAQMRGKMEDERLLTVREVSEAGHWVMIEEPERVNVLLEEFLEG